MSLTLCDPVGYTVHGICQARILEWVAFPFSRGSSQGTEPRSPTLQTDFLPSEPPGKRFDFSKETTKSAPRRLSQPDSLLLLMWSYFPQPSLTDWNGTILSPADCSFVHIFINKSLSIYHVLGTGHTLVSQTGPDSQSSQDSRKDGQANEGVGMNLSPHPWWWKTLLVLQIKMTVRYHLTQVRKAIIKKPTNNKCGRGCGEKRSLLHCWWEYKLVQPL